MHFAMSHGRADEAVPFAAAAAARLGLVRFGPQEGHLTPAPCSCAVMEPTTCNTHPFGMLLSLILAFWTVGS